MIFRSPDSDPPPTTNHRRHGVPVDPSRTPQRPKSTFLYATGTFLGSFGLVAAILCTLAWISVSGAQNDKNTTADNNQLQLKYPRVTILKSARQLMVFEGDSLMRVYPIRLGSSPVGQKLRSGDGRTPEGVFRVVTKRVDSPNHRFLGISYPDVSAANRGLADGLISRGEALAIEIAQQQHICPSWTTALGGGIGIHGDSGSPGPTAGCIGLSDAHVAELFDVLRIGDTVEILP